MASGVPQRILTLALAGLLGLSLAGCVSVERAPQSTSSAETTPNASTVPTASATIPGTATPQAKDPSGTASGTAVVPKQTASADGFDVPYHQILAHASTLACDGSTTTLQSDGKVLHLQGDCRTVSITGTGNMVVAERIGTLSISGAGNIVAVKSLDELTVRGVGNVVGWRSGHTVSDDSGQNNTLGRGALDGLPLSF